MFGADILNIAALGIKLDAKPAIDGLKKLKGEMSKTAKEGEKDVKKLKASFVTLTAAAASFGAALKIGDEFKRAMREIQVGTGATGDTLQGLQRDFEAIYRNVPNQMGAVSGAVSALNTATGASGQSLRDMTEATANLTNLLGGDLTANAGALGQLLNQWGIAAEDATQTTDMLYVATQKYGIGLQGILTQLNEYGPVMKNAGFTTAQTADFFGQLHSVGISVSRVMPAVNKLFRDMATAGIDGKEALSLLVSEISGAKTETEALALATEAFGAEGAQRMTTAIRSGAIAMEEWGTIADNATGSVKTAAEENRTLAEAVSLLWHEIELQLAPASMQLNQLVIDLIPTIKEFAKQIGEVISDVVDWVRENKELSVTLLAMAVGGGPVALLTSAIATLASTITKTLIVALTSIVRHPALAVLVGLGAAVSYSVAELNEAMDFHEARQGLDELNESLKETKDAVKLGEAIEQGTAMMARMQERLKELNDDMAESQAVASHASSTYQLFLGPLEQQNVNNYSGEIEELKNDMETLGDSLASALAELNGMSEELKDNEGKTESVDDAAKKFALTLDKLRSAFGKTGKASKDQKKETDKLKESTQDVVEELLNKNRALTLTEREMYRYRLMMADASESEIEQALRIYDTNRALEEKKEKLKEVTRDTEIESIGMAETLKDAFSRVNLSFVELWESALNGFKDFAGTLKRALLQLLAELANILFTRNLAVNITAGVTGAVPGVAGAAGVAGTPGGGFGSILSGAAEMFSNSVGSFANALNQATSGITGGTAWFGGTNAAVGAYGLGGGLIGSMLFPDNPGASIGGGIGGAAGGMIGTQALGWWLGSFAGPVGMIIGAALGSAIGSLIGSNKDVTPDLTIGTGVGSKIGTLGVSEGDLRGYVESAFGQFGIVTQHDMFKDASQAEPVIQMLNAFAEFENQVAQRIGEEATESVRKALEEEAQRIKVEEPEMAEDAIRDYLKGRFKTIMEASEYELAGLVMAFGDTVEEWMMRLGMLWTLEDLAGFSPMEAGKEMYTAANRDATAALGDMETALYDIIAGFDGSTESLQLMTEAVGQFANASAQMIARIQEIRASISELTGRNVETIKTDLMDSEQLYNYYRSQAEELTRSLATMTNADQIQATVEEINRLAMSAWNVLTNEQKADVQQEFIGFLEKIDEIAGRQLEVASENIERNYQRVTDAFTQAINDVAERFNDAVDNFAAVASQPQRVEVVITYEGTGESRRATPSIELGGY